MMKSFFKKLAFVMALAMVVTTAAPAAQAVAAEKSLAITYQNEKTYSISEVNLANVGDTEDLKFLWAPSNWKELGVNWTSSNENVVTVDDNGVITGIAAGTATVSVAVGTQTASVTVNVKDLPAYTVSIGEGSNKSVTEWELEIGESVDFAFYGIKDYARDKVGALPRYLCTWQSDDTTVLTKDNEAGLFTAVAAGTAKVTLTVANVLTGQTHNVIPVAVTVKAPVVEVKEQNIVADINKTQNTFEITLDKAGSLDINKVEVFRVFFADDDYNGDGKIDERDIDKAYENVYVNKVTGSGTAWTVETFDDFIDGVTYEVQVNGYKAERFVASVGAVAEVVVLEKDGAALATEETSLDAAHVTVKLYDKNGVDVTTRKIDGIKNNDSSNVTFWLTEDNSAYAMTGYDEIEFYEMATAAVMATYFNDGVDVDSADPCFITPSQANEYGIKRVVMWTLVAPNGKADWTKEVHEVPSGEYGYTIATLLEDTRGNYFTTHEASASVKYNGNAVYYTEDENAAFWIHGFRVEYRAMNPDVMLVEDYGDVASYVEGRARFALYLYNQFKDGDQFVSELYSQYVKVCCPIKMDDMTATNNITILTNTEHDGTESNAYYSLFSTKKLTVELKDKYHNIPAKAEHAAEAYFEIKLITAKASNESAADYEALKNLIEVVYAAELNGSNANKREVVVEANDFAAINCKKTQVKFTIKEAVTGKSQTVTITLKTPVLETDDNGNTSAQVATIDEYFDKLGIKLPFEKFVTGGKSFTVEQKITDATKANDNNTVLLKQADKNGNEIGVDNNLFVATTVDTANMTTADVVNGGNLVAGDRVLVIKGTDGKIYPSYNGQYGVYKNPAYTTKVPAGYEMTETTTDLKVEVAVKSGYAESASGTSVDVNQYNFVFRTVDADGEIIYAKDGRYNVTILTVKEIASNGKITFTKSTGLTDSFVITVQNNNAEVKYAGRDITRVEGSISSYNWGGQYSYATSTINAEYGDDAAVKALILEAFDFNLGSKANWNATANDILYYTYTLTPTNKQVVINKVVFAVPADAASENKGGYGWYRSEAVVNKSLTFDFE